MYDITKNFPENEYYGLFSQLRRAAMSVSLNLAEGFSGYYKDEKNRYFRIAKRSVQECVPALKVSLKQNYIDKKEFDLMYKECYELSRKISGLIKYVDNNFRCAKTKKNRK
jgi:four helix bundle protein